MKGDSISRQAAIDAIRKEYAGIHNACFDGDFLSDEMEFIIRKVPSVEAVPVIRCKDCKHCDDGKWCIDWGSMTTSDGYCSNAERRTDE